MHKPYVSSDIQRHGVQFVLQIEFRYMTAGAAIEFLRKIYETASKSATARSKTLSENLCWCLEYMRTSTLYIRFILSYKYFFYTDGLGFLGCSRSELIMKFWILQRVGRTTWTVDQPDARLLPHRTTQTQNKSRQISMLRFGFEPTIPVYEGARTFHAFDRAATIFGSC
jgi:hypothetical protein